MAGFRKASAPQSALKVSIYGPPGSGKTYSTLLFAEGLAKATGKRVAFVDTELGTAFYSKRVAERTHHPEAFDFDALYTRSITEVLSACKGLKPAEHSVVVIDSITHIWEAAKASYTGAKTKVGSLPMHAWGKIKAPYKELLSFLINSPYHVFILGRQGNEFAEDEETGEVKATGFKMKAEGETAYEPHICFRLESWKPPLKKGQKHASESVPVLHVEKDRTGLLQGKVIEWPSFDNVCRPLLGLLGQEHAQVPTEDDAAATDAEALLRSEQDKARRSRDLADRWLARFQLCDDLAEAEAISKEITPAVKKEMLTLDIEKVRAAYLATTHKLKGLAVAGANGQHTLGDAAE